jgi:fructosamine-3-kinase
MTLPNVSSLPRTPISASKHPLAQAAPREAIERAVSSYRGSPWTVRTLTDLADYASHPCAILAGHEHRSGSFEVFAKLNSSPNGAEQFEIELSGLRLLSERAGVRTPTPIGPGIVETEAGAVLLTESFNAVERGPAQWREIGRSVAMIHSVRGDRFGLNTDGTFGPLFQDNRLASNETWAAFYGERRVWPRLVDAMAAGHLPVAIARRVESLIERLPELCGPDVAPTLLHGDAQQNNFVSTAEGAVVIDAAVYYGHPEMDLALMDYFQEASLEWLDGYRELRLVDAGFVSRRSLWRIHAYLAVTTDAVAAPAFVPRLAAALDEYL